MRLTRSEAVSVLLVTCVFAQGAVKRVYFLRDDAQKKWCGYADESRFKTEVQSLGAMVVGAVYYAAGRVSKVHVTEADETGDWAINDEYSVDEKGRISGLTRTINIIPENTSEEQVFRIEGGKAILLQSRHTDLHAGKPTKNRADWFKPTPVIKDLGAFPFWPLVSTKRQAVWAAGEGCVPDSAQSGRD